MTYIVDTPLQDFDFWGGAEDKANLLTSSQLKSIDDILSEETDHTYTEDEVNDLFRFDFASVCELIGLTYDEDKNIVVENTEEQEE